MKYSVEEFAQELRKKYPRVYDDLDDDELVGLWVKKFPNDKKNINFYQVHEQVYEQEYETGDGIWGSIKKILTIIIISSVVLYGVYFYNDSTQNNTVTVDNSVGESNEFESNQIDSSITQEVSESEQNIDYYENQNQSLNENIESQNRKCSYCNGTGKCRQCGKTFRKSYYKGNGSYDNRNESRPGLVMCSDCMGRGHKQVKRNEGGWEPGGDCYVSDCQDGWKSCRECNSYGNGKFPGQCKECKGTGYEN